MNKCYVCNKEAKLGSCGHTIINNKKIRLYWCSTACMKPFIKKVYDIEIGLINQLGNKGYLPPK